MPKVERAPTTALSPLPLVFALEQNHPNPFDPTTTIDFSLDQDANVRLLIFDTSGRAEAGRPAVRGGYLFRGLGRS